MDNLTITALFAAAFAVGLILISAPISLRRVKVGVLTGLGNDAVLQRRIRAQGNFTEYVPIALIVMGLAETRHAATWVVVVIGALLALGRLLHAIGMWRDQPAFRGIGMTLTYAALAAGAVALLYSAADLGLVHA